MSAVPEKAAAAGSEATRCWTRPACEILRKLRAAEDIHKARHDLIDSLIWVALESLFHPGARSDAAEVEPRSPALPEPSRRMRAAGGIGRGASKQGRLPASGRELAQAGREPLIRREHGTLSRVCDRIA